MAENGARRNIPGTHRLRGAATMSAAPPLTAPLQPFRTPPVVSLSAPRPPDERQGNEYVEAPCRPHRPTVRLPVTKQPVGSSKCATAAGPSIMCSECGRCKCDSCGQPRPLPERWICNDKCFCSADATIDYATCLCCAKGLFYHCSETESESCADDPCGCGPHNRSARWTCLAALSCVLPCLWLYWPLQACKSALETCYARHSAHGCRCRPALAKRLLPPENT